MSEETASTRRRRGPRVLVLLGWGLVSVLVLVAIAWFFVLPGAFENRLIDALVQQGFVGVESDGVELATDEIRVRGLRWGKAEDGASVRLETVHLEYSAATILRGRLDRVVLRGVDLRLGAADAPFDGILPQRPSDPTRSSTQEARLLPELPFELLLVEKLRVRGPLGLKPSSAEARGELRIFTSDDPAADVRLAWEVEGSCAVDGVTLPLSTAGQFVAVGPVVEGPVQLVIGERDAQPLEYAGRFEVRRDEELVSGRVELEGKGRFAFEHPQRRLGGRIAESSLEFAWGEARTARLRARVPQREPLVLAGPGWPAAMRGLRASGRFDVLHDSSGTVFRAKSTELSVPSSTDEVRWAVDGLRATMHASSPVGADAFPDEVAWRTLRFGPQTFGRGEAVYRFAPGWQQLEIVRAKLSTEVDAIGPLSSAYLAVRDQRVDFEQDSIEAEIGLVRVDLQGWLDRFAEFDVRADALVSGRMKALVTLRPRLHVRLIGGRVAATGPGRIRFAEDAKTVSAIAPYVEQIAGRVAPGHEKLVEQRIFGSLRDFAYETLSLDVVDKDGAPSLAVQLKGKGREVPQELDVTVNVHGVQDLLDLAFDLNEAVEQTKRRVEAGLEKPQREKTQKKEK